MTAPVPGPEPSPNPDVEVQGADFFYGVAEYASHSRRETRRNRPHGVERFGDFGNEVLRTGRPLHVREQEDPASRLEPASKLMRHAGFPHPPLSSEQNMVAIANPGLQNLKFRSPIKEVVGTHPTASPRSHRCRSFLCGAGRPWQSTRPLSTSLLTTSRFDGPCGRSATSRALPATGTPVPRRASPVRARQTPYSAFTLSRVIRARSSAGTFSNSSSSTASEHGHVESVWG